MSRKIIRTLLVSIAVFAAMVILGYFAHLFTLKSVEDSLSHNETLSAETSSETKPLEESQIEEFDYYLAKLEDGKIAIYICGSETKKFLYTLDVYTKDLPEQDITQLTEGIELHSKKELVQFEEDFTS